MLRRLLGIITKKLKDVTMSEVRASSPLIPKEETGEKRPLDDGDKEESDSKKVKTQSSAPLPMQGRADRKRKVALLIAYCGDGYYGIQFQKSELKTIESEIIKALLAAKLIPKEHAETPQKMSFQRAARTDKNVSAAGNVLSLKMLVEDDAVEKINTHLPPEIRAIACLRTTRSFDGKNHCTARTYKYMLPTYSFAPFEKFVTKDYRVEEGTIQRVNEVLTKFKGTHNFHNFTSGRKANDPSSKRYIISFECCEPFVRDGIEFAVLTVKGQSFMLHHIRKMIGLMVSIIRGYCGLEAMEKSWGSEKIDIPKAPGLGLFLDKLFYDGYNKKFGKDGIHEPINWDKYQETLERFKEEHILSNIVKSEVQQGVMLQWLGTLQCHKFDVIDPTMGAPPEGEKDLNWWRTKLLLRKIDNEAKKQAQVAEGSLTGTSDVQATSNAAESVEDKKLDTCSAVDGDKETLQDQKDIEMSEAKSTDSSEATTKDPETSEAKDTDASETIDAASSQVKVESDISQDNQKTSESLSDEQIRQKN